MLAAKQSVQNAYKNVRDAYNDLEKPDQKSMRLRLAATSGCILSFLLVCISTPTMAILYLIPCVWSAVAMTLVLRKFKINPIASIIFDLYSAGFIGFYAFVMLVGIGWGASQWLWVVLILLLASAILYVSLAIHTGLRMWKGRSPSGGTGAVRLPL